MKGRRSPLGLPLALVLACCAGTAAAQTGDPTVLIAQPPPGEPAFGMVRFEAFAKSEWLDRVELYVDGKLVGTMKQPPFATVVDVGDENVAHKFEAVAYNKRGERANAVMETATIHVDEEISAELQQLYVTVTSGKQRVLDLEQDDFAIIDENVQEEIVTFAKGEVPLAATVLIDASASMSGERLRSALRGAETFLRAMRPGDNTSVVLFSDRWLQATPFSGNAEELIASLRGVKAAGGTALNDTLYLAMKKLEAEQGRRVIILLSDGIDSHSALRMPEVTWLAQRSRALIYWIRTDPRSDSDIQLSSAWKDPETYREERRALTSTVLETGGRVVELKNLKEAEGAFSEILAELREQFALGYYPTINRGNNSWHRITVRVRRPDLSVRTRNGYIDY
jgi:Ca-activated chloride channel family protein